MITKENSYILVCTPSKNIFVHYKNGEVVKTDDAKDVYMKNYIGHYHLAFSEEDVDNWLFSKFLKCVDIPRQDINHFPGDKVHFQYNEISPISDNMAIVTQNSKYKGKTVYTREDLKYFPSVVYAAVLGMLAEQLDSDQS